MDQPARPFTSEGTDARRWFGRIIIAVLLGEATWGLIVSVMNNVFVPWLGDFMGQSSGLPTSFTQRPYNYPELFVSVFEFCIAGLVAAILNYFFQRPSAAKGRIVKSQVPAAQPGPVRVIPQAIIAAPPPAASPVAPAQVAKADSVLPPAPVVASPVVASPVVAAPVVAAPVRPAPVVAAPVPPPAVAPAPVVRPVAAIPPAPAAASPVPTKPQAPAAKLEPEKPKKAKEVYYNIVGEPMPSDDD